MFVMKIIMIIQPVWDPNLDMASAKVEMEVQVTGVKFNTKEMAALDNDDNIDYNNDECDNDD